jgi:hypothetical protein
MSTLCLVFITKLTFSPNTDKCGKVTKTEKGLSRLTTILLWIILGSVILNI